MIRKIITFIAIVVINSGGAFAQGTCDGQTTKEIESCTRGHIEVARKELDRVYGRMQQHLSAPDKLSLVAAQRYWSLYKDKYCQEAFDATYPGEEAEIDRLSCLRSVTDMRISELRYINASDSMQSFYAALTVVAGIYENGNQGRVIEKLITRTPDANNSDWSRYVEVNCKLTRAKLHEEHRLCVARMNFYKNW